jgi:P2 family phage contractile tail tube protein
MAQVYVIESANLFAGAEDASSSKHLTIRDLKLPTMEEKQAEHHPGGSIFAVQISSLGFNALSATFHLVGFDPAMLKLFGLGQQLRRRYTAYGAVRDKLSGGAVQAKAIMEGRLQRIEPGAFNRGDLVGHDYAVSEIVHYELYFDGEEKFYLDFATQEWRVDGTEENDTRRLLGLGS